MQRTHLGGCYSGKQLRGLSGADPASDRECSDRAGGVAASDGAIGVEGCHVRFFSYLCNLWGGVAPELNNRE